MAHYLLFTKQWARVVSPREDALKVMGALLVPIVGAVGGSQPRVRVCDHVHSGLLGFWVREDARTLDGECVALLVALDGHRQVARRAAAREAAHPSRTTSRQR